MKKYFALAATVISTVFILVGIAGLSLLWSADRRFEASLEHPGFALRWMVFFGVACFCGLAAFFANARWYAAERMN